MHFVLSRFCLLPSTVFVRFLGNCSFSHSLYQRHSRILLERRIIDTFHCQPQMQWSLVLVAQLCIFLRNNATPCAFDNRQQLLLHILSVLWAHFSLQVESNRKMDKIIFRNLIVRILAEILPRWSTQDRGNKLSFQYESKTWETNTKL